MSDLETPAGTLQRKCEEITRDAKTVDAGVVVHDHETSFHFSWNGDRVFHAASTIKVALLLAVFRAADEGRLQLDDPLHVRNRFISAADGAPFHLDADNDGSSQLYRSVGRTAKIADLAEAMIIVSSNLATNLLLDFVSVDYARETIRAAGVTGVELRRGVADEAAHAAGMNNETTAEGLAQLFGVLRGDFLSKASRDAAIAILLKQRFDSMIPASLPSHATVAHKTGEISTACHDAGIVYLPERQPYVVAILTEVDRDSSQRRETVARISEAVFECIAAQTQHA